MSPEPIEVHRSTAATIEIASVDLIFRSVALDTGTPTGGKIAKAAGFVADQYPYVLQWREDGDLSDLRVHEEADLRQGRKFIVAESDSSNRITIEGEEFDWPAATISGSVVRQLGRIPPEWVLYLERVDEPDKRVNDDDIIKIKGQGIERFHARKPEVWELNVQGKRIESTSPTISVIDALTRAGFDPNVWIIILKVHGQPKRQLAIGDVIDLRAPGIEKIRLTAKDVNNGEARSAPLRDFPLLENDDAYLDGLCLPWETIISDGHRWLVIRNYPVPSGYNVSSVTLALLIPPLYPQAEIDMFYVYPMLQKNDGIAIPSVQIMQPINGVAFQRWSRHRGQVQPWDPKLDNVQTHLALVDTAVAREVGA